MKVPFQMCQVTVVCADLSELLFDLNMLGVSLHHLCRIDDLTASFCVQQGQYNAAVAVIKKLDGKIVNSIPASANIVLKGLLRRPVLILGGMLLLFLTFYIPTRILFVTVSGNERIPRKQIIASASDCGVGFGVARHEIRSEIIKNRLLSALPELQWVGVNTRGCVAHISVRERTVQEPKRNEPMVSSLIASCDGVIREMTVRSGNAISRVGQAVKKGQLLVSGYSDCGRCIYGTRADAEIYAQTSRTLRLSVLTDSLKRDVCSSSSRKYGLIVGKKRINFYKGSGIYDTTCVRMYMEYPLTLPGGYILPIALAVQEEIDCEPVPESVSPAKSKAVLDQFARSYLESQMIAGKVEQGNCQLTESDGALHLRGKYICDEMIGQTHSEEIVDNYEQTD